MSFSFRHEGIGHVGGIAHGNVKTHEFSFPLASGFSLELLIGLVGTFVGLALTAVGLMVQKYALNTREREEGKEGRSCIERPCVSKCWVLGMTIFCVGNLIFWAVTALVPQVVLACWQCWAMIVTVFFAPPLLGETVSCWKLLSILVIVIGLVWVVLASPSGEEPYTTEQFWTAIRGTSFITITVVSGLVFVSLVVSLFFVKLTPRIGGFRYILIAVLINWYSVLCARCSSEFMITSVHYGINQADKLDFYVLIAGMLVFAVSNVYFLNKALEIGEAVFVVPVYEAFAIGGQFMFGIVFFEEFKGLTGWEQFNIWVGASVVLTGVVLTSVAAPRIKFLRQTVLAEDYCERYCWFFNYICCCCCCRRRAGEGQDEERAPIIDPAKKENASPMTSDDEAERYSMGETGGTFPKAKRRPPSSATASASSNPNG